MATTSKSWSKNFNQSTKLDRDLLLCIFILMGVGLVMVYSASFIFASQKYADGLYFFKKQTLFIGISLGALAAMSQVPFQVFKKYFWAFWLALMVLLVAVLVPGLGHRAGGATRWIPGPFGFRFEPSELFKLSAPFMAAYFYPAIEERNFKKLALAAFALGAPILLLLRQPDFGSVFIFICVLASVFFCAGLSWRYFLSSALIILPSLAYLVLSSPYRRERLQAFLNPWEDISGGGFQVIQSMLGLFSGGLFGTGLGKGQAKLFFLPEAHTDFILAVLGEEVGFMGLLFVIILFLWLLIRSIQVAMRCEDLFAQRVAIGISSLLGFEILINACVVTGLLPTKGLTMPFLSYGGSSLLVTSIAIGMLLSIHRMSQPRKKRA